MTLKAASCLPGLVHHTLALQLLATAPGRTGSSRRWGSCAQAQLLRQGR